LDMSRLREVTRPACSGCRWWLGPLANYSNRTIDLYNAIIALAYNAMMALAVAVCWPWALEVKQAVGRHIERLCAIDCTILHD
jgi:hypothetical protein